MTLLYRTISCVVVVAPCWATAVVHHSVITVNRLNVYKEKILFALKQMIKKCKNQSVQKVCAVGTTVCTR